ncbi:zinc finger protein 729-like [Plodia interpunctella]|uniref:zinc finger protein 729-like n=1 Tax=Plodia interpunctella TaxID=58824 RepID=UPI002367C9AB|nr:zinc finger protein 729-like [Plodia interpunctella]
MDRRLKNDHGEATATLKQVTGKEKLSIVRKNVINVVTNTNVMPFRWLKSSYRCFYCYDVFQEPKDLKSHNEIHAPEKEIEKIMNNYWESSVYVDISNMRCKLCTDVAIDFHKIIDHLITVHRVSFDKDFGTCMSPFKLHDISVECVTCEKHYRTFGHLLVHSNKEHKGCSQLLCEICGQHFRHPSNLRDHVNKEHNKQTVDCNLCGETLPSMNRMRTHMQHFHNKRYKCFKCADLFETHYKRSLHMMNVHKSRDEVKCQHCPKTFVFRSTMMRHVRETHLQEKNAVCEEKSLISKRLDDAKLLRDLADLRALLTAVIEYSTIMPFRWCSNKYMCFYCRCPFSSSVALKEHTASEHDNPRLKYILQTIRTSSKIKLDVTEIVCKKCNKSLENLMEFFDHLNAVHDMKLNRDVSVYMFAYKLSDDGMSCLDCGQKFLFFGTLISHAHKLHTKTEMCLCEICGQAFSGRANVMNHVRTVHRIDNRCNKCYRSYSSEAALAAHTRRVHRQDKLKCPKCPEILRTTYIRQRHMALVHDVKKYQFSCDICAKTFTCLSVVAQHKARMHMKEKNFACEICGFKVFSKDLLKKHMVKHDDSRPFQCEICKKAFQRKKTLDLHIRIHTNDKRYVCKVCGKAFIQVTSLKLHGKVHHSVPDVSWS